MKQICQDLKAEYDALDDMVSGLSEAEWNKTTPFFEWTIKDEISHISYFDSAGLQAATDRQAFQKGIEDFLSKMSPSDNFHEIVNAIGRKMEIDDLLKSWRNNRNQLVKALNAHDSKDRLPWYGPDMSARSFATARLMETWAHGQDVADALKIRRVATDRIKNIAHLGYTTYNWTFINRKMDAPDSPVYVKLKSPSGNIWTWGSENTENCVTGTAEDFCMVVTQRRNAADTKLAITGEPAALWMSLAQCFAGPPENPPKPGKRVVKY